MDSARWLELGEPVVSLRLGGRRGVILILALAILAGWAGHQAAVFLLLGLLGLVGLARLWADHALDTVDARIEVVESRAFPGDDIRLTLVVENRKLLPLTWLRARAAIPPALTPTAAPLRWPYADSGGYLQGLTALSWRTKAAWDFDLPCRQRGEYRVGPIELSSGDPFGLLGRREVLHVYQTLVIYPRIIPLRRLGFPLPPEPGAMLPRRSYQEDPSRLAGVRLYRPGDPPRRIHWPASARQGELQVRLLEGTSAPSITLLIACDTFDFPWSRFRHDLFEIAMSASASIATRALDNGWPVSLLAGGLPPVRVPPSTTHQQLGGLLEALARLSPGSPISVADLVTTESLGARRATTVIIAGRANDSLRTALVRLQAMHRQVVLLYGEDAPTTGPRLPGYRLRAWDDLARTLEGRGETVGGG